jgi:hypothetical protein
VNLSTQWGSSEETSANSVYSNLPIVVITSIFWFVSGIIGVVCGLFLWGSLRYLSSVSGFALGQVFFAALLTEEPALIVTVLGELALVLLLLSPTLRKEGVVVSKMSLLIIGAVIGVVIVFHTIALSLWIVAAIISMLLLALGYGFHRYSVVLFQVEKNE